VINVILGIITMINLLFLASGYFIWRWQSFVLIPLAGAAFLWLLLLAYHLLSGPTCICYLRTAVQFEALPSLYRIKTARKAIALLRQRIEAYQGPLPAESS
jgi:hypothetical protein